MMVIMLLKVMVLVLIWLSLLKQWLDLFLI